MKKIPQIAKGLQNVANAGVPAVPSVSSTPIKINYKQVPGLQNFVKSPAVTSIESRTAGIYKLVRHSNGGKGSSEIQLVLSYKLGKTKYRITSYKKRKVEGKASGQDGTIQISKNYFQKREFELKELPKNIVESINNNIVIFNEVYAGELAAKATKLKQIKEEKEHGFFNGLDT